MFDAMFLFDKRGNFRILMLEEVTRENIRRSMVSSIKFFILSVISKKMWIL